MEIKEHLKNDYVCKNGQTGFVTRPNYFRPPTKSL